MKKIVSIIFTGISLLFLTSCNDNFLEKYPTDQISEGTFWRTEKDAKMALAGVYNSMMYRSAFNHGRMILDGLTDIGYSSAYPNIGQGIIESSTGSIISSTYSDCYAGISRCNIFLANIDKTEMTAQNIAIAKGEVLFLRAYFYFTLTEFYGGVPLYTKPVSIEEAIVEQSSKDAVVTQVLADLDQAIANLPDQTYTGHAVKGSALALKAQALMHNQKWAEAATTANQIITSGKFSLYNNYPNLFLAKGQENNPEIIFSVRFLNPDAGINQSGYAPMNPNQISAHGHI